MITTLEPGPTSASRRPCSATDAMVVNAASCAGTPSGTGAAQEAGHRLELGVAGFSCTARRHELTGADAGDRTADLKDNARGRVAQWHIAGESVPDRTRCDSQAL